MENRRFVLERLRQGLASLEACRFDDQERVRMADTEGIVWDKDYEKGFLAFYQALEVLQDDPNAEGVKDVFCLLKPLRVFYSHPPDIKGTTNEREIRVVNPDDDGTGVREVLINLHISSETAYANYGKRVVDCVPTKQTLIDSTKKLIYYLEERYEQGGKIDMSASLVAQHNTQQEANP